MMMGKGEIAQTSFEGMRVLITNGAFADTEGVCLGKTEDPDLWAVSPDDSAHVISLRFEKDFGLFVDLSSNPSRNWGVARNFGLGSAIKTPSRRLYGAANGILVNCSD